MAKNIPTIFVLGCTSEDKTLICRSLIDDFDDQLFGLSNEEIRIFEGNGLKLIATPDLTRSKEKEGDNEKLLNALANKSDELDELEQTAIGFILIVNVKNLDQLVFTLDSLIFFFGEEALNYFTLIFTGMTQNVDGSFSMGSIENSAHFKEYQKMLKDYQQSKPDYILWNENGNEELRKELASLPIWTANDNDDNKDYDGNEGYAPELVKRAVDLAKYILYVELADINLLGDMDESRENRDDSNE